MKTPLLSGILFQFAALLASAASPDFQSGDLIFQTSGSPQSQMIQVATGSKFSHVGIVEVRANGQQFVVEAIAHVSETPLTAWIARGNGGQFALYRDDALTPEQRQDLVASAKKFLGVPYDIYFTSHNTELYCSELVDVAARAIGLTFGHYQKLGTLNVSDARVVALMRARWQGHPLCRGIPTFEACLPRILDDELITPVSLTEDSQFRRVYSNYSWF